MPLRTRTKFGKREKSYLLNPTNMYSWTPFAANGRESPGCFIDSATATDDVSPGDGKSFQMDSYQITSDVRCQVKIKDGPGTLIYKDWPVLQAGESGAWQFGNCLSHCPVSQSSLDVLSTKVLARTNPSSPVVDVPAFIGELRDLPHLVKVAGDNIIETVAKANLAYNFGWRPLVSDLMKMLNFNRHADARYLQLKRLYNGGLSTKCKLEDGNGQAVINSTMNVANNLFWAANITKITKQTQYKCWGHAKWKPTTLPPSGGNVALYELARRATLGLYADPSTAWELMPWSWLADWFGTIGDFLNASRNFIPAKCVQVNIMQQKETSFSADIQKYPYVFWSEDDPHYVEFFVPKSVTGKSISKARLPGNTSPTISADLEWLSSYQWGILASLAVLKGRSAGGFSNGRP